jgi:NADH-quinone oxidoreductase subunit K
MPPLAYFLGLSVLLFAAGFVGVISRRNALMIFMSLELMFNAANLAFVTFAAYYQVLNAQLFVFFIISIAAAEVAIGLALIVQIFRSKKSIDVDQMSQLKDEEYKES